MTDTSQNGEATIVAGCFPPDHKGFLVEIGAWEPVNFSNSRLFIERGWDAVLCEFSPMPVHKLLQAYDAETGDGRIKIVQAAITACDQHVREFSITEDALSTDSLEQMSRWGSAGGYYGALWVPTLTWDKLKDQFFPKRIPDFVSVDTEGSSVELAIVIMQSNWRPKVLVVEHNGRDIELWQVAKPLGYKMVDKTQENLILCR